MFTYGSGGYSTVHVGDLARVSDTSLDCNAAAGPIVSRYNASYSCSITRVTTDGMVVRVGFKVTGDGSLGELQHPSHCQLLLEDASGPQHLLVFSDDSHIEYSPNVSSGTLVYVLPLRLQTHKPASGNTNAGRYLSTPQPNAAVAQHFALWICVALAKTCCDLVLKLLSSGTLFDLQLLLDSVEQPPDAAGATSAILAVVAKLRQENRRLPLAPYFGEVVDAVMAGKQRPAASVAFATALLSAAAPGAFMLSRRALTFIDAQLHPSALSSQPAACLVTLPDWVCNATSPQRCCFMPLFFAGSPLIVMPNMGWADIIVHAAPKRVSVPCACVIAALLSPAACLTAAQLSDATGLPQPTVEECMQLLLSQDACVSVTSATQEPSYSVRDSADWREDGWVVLNHTSLNASCSFISPDYAAVCHWCDPSPPPPLHSSTTHNCRRYAVRLAAAPALDLCESVCDCSHSLSLPHAHVTYAVSRMTQERVLALSHGYVCDASRLPCISLQSMPPSSIAASSDRSMLPQLCGPLALFQRLVLVAPQAHTRDEPLPYSHSLAAAITLAVPALDAEITRTVLALSKMIGADCALISGDARHMSHATHVSRHMSHERFDRGCRVQRCVTPAHSHRIV